MKSHELCRELLQKSNAKQLAADMGLSTSMIYKWAEPVTEGGSGAVNPLDRIDQLIQFTGDERIARWVCERSGGFFVANPNAEVVHERPHSNELTSATNETVHEFAEMLGVVAIAAIDNSICEKEAQEIREHWQKLKSIVEEFVRSCEGGQFKGAGR